MLALVPLLLTLAAPPGGATIEGTVRDQGGTPLAGAVIVVDGRLPGARSDARGHYRLQAIPAGRHVLRATLAGYQPYERVDLVLKEGARVVEDIVLAALPATSPVAAVQEAKDEATKTYRHAPGSPATTQANGGFFRPPHDTEDYHHFNDNRFLTVGANPLSTFAIDVDAASYANVRRFLTEGRMPPADAVRVEELINYFPYDYPAPTGEHPFSVTTAQMPAPWAKDHRLVLVGIQGRRIEAERLPPSNLVFLLDVSGSMSSPDKLPLVKRAFRLLVEQLRPQDRVAIVVYAGAAGLVLPSTPGSDRQAILAALDRLEAGGSTAGGAGLKLAYDVAREHRLPGGNNRVILATDGDFNVGVSSEGELVRLIEDRKREGTFLTVLGFGTGNLKDSRMEALADKGNGHYAYVDDILEARKVFVHELGATLVTIAKDVKVQVEFNPAQVAEYRLVGYENRLLAAEDFNDDAKDGGELGAGHSVTAIYEIVPAGRRGSGSVDELRYQSRDVTRGGDRNEELLTVKLRYQPPSGGTSRLVSRVVRAGERGAPGTLGFAAAVAEFGMLLRNSEYKGTSSWDDVLRLAKGGMGRDPGGYRAEFVRLVEVARGMTRGGSDVGMVE
jgi:Ca-activated chloride channel family protein